jgi:MinD superfamily P-loop ATPase
MKQLVILSGKGGTGKTSLAAALAHLAQGGGSPLRVVLADADVDAANLELVLTPHILERHEFMGGVKAYISSDRCTRCGRCAKVCRFDAIPTPTQDGQAFSVDPIACDGCAACAYQCPASAIEMQDELAGHWFRSESRYGPLFHASLLPAHENSGKLVTLVKHQACLLAQSEQADLVIVDGPPGIGCPVISALAGADVAVIVVEPSIAGIHDMARVLQVAQHFRVPALVCVNKADLYTEGTAQIEAYCRQNDVEVMGHIPFDPSVTDAMKFGAPVTAYHPEAPSSAAIAALWGHIVSRL